MNCLAMLPGGMCVGHMYEFKCQIYSFKKVRILGYSHIDPKLDMGTGTGI